MQPIYKSGLKGKIVDFDEALMKAMLAEPNVDYIRVFNKDDGPTGRLTAVENETQEVPLSRKRIENIVENIVENKVNEYFAKRNIYKDFFELTGESIKRKNLLEPHPFTTNALFLARKHY